MDIIVSANKFILIRERQNSSQFQEENNGLTPPKNSLTSPQESNGETNSKIEIYSCKLEISLYMLVRIKIMSWLPNQTNQTN